MTATSETAIVEPADLAAGDLFHAVSVGSNPLTFNSVSGDTVNYTDKFGYKGTFKIGDYVVVKETIVKSETDTLIETIEKEIATLSARGENVSNLTTLVETLKGTLAAA